MDAMRKFCILFAKAIFIDIVICEFTFFIYP